MGNVIIKCANCGNEWPKEIQDNNGGDCPICGRNYCAKWRKWEWVESEVKMKRLHELTPQQIDEWRKARLAWGQTIYGDRDLQRYNLVDVMEELLDCLNILERFENRLSKVLSQEQMDLIKKTLCYAGLKCNIDGAIHWLLQIDGKIPDEECTDENGGERIWWNNAKA